MTTVHAPGLEVEIADHVAWVTLARPEKLNALTSEMMDALPQVLEAAAARDDVRCLVLRGAGRAFCAGGDLATVDEALRHERPEIARLMERRQRASLLLAEMPIPTIASVNGVAAGAGMAIALACDLRIAAESARFVTAFAPIAFCGDFGGTWTLQRLIGPARARELYFLGGALDAREAHALGVVSRCVPDARLAEETASVAARIAAMSPIALRRMKANMNLALRADLATLLRAEAEGSAALMGTQDNREAIAAFREKRAPRFEGR